VQILLSGKSGAATGRPALPEDRPRKKGRLCRPPEAYPDELGEEYAKTLIEPGSGGRLDSHFVEDLLS
jgi:hypothetical protein